MTGNDLLNYRGDAALGLGQTGGLSAYGEIDLKDANNSFNTLSYLNMQKNKEVWQQKIKDRDEGMELIRSGKLALNNALPQDRAKLMGMIDKVKDIYFSHNGDVKSDPKVFLQLNEELAKFSNANTIAQSRLMEYNKGKAEAAKETNPYRKRKMNEHWEREIAKDIYEPLQPYQQTLDFDGELVRPKMIETTTEKGLDPNKQYHRLSETRTDVASSFRDYENKYVYGGKEGTAINVDEYLNNWMGQNGILAPDLVMQQRDDVNARLRQIAKLEGYNPDDPAAKLPVYLQPLKMDVVNGQVQSGSNKWTDWFKIQLADQYKRGETSKFDDNLAKLDKTRADISLIRAKIGTENAKQRNTNAKTAALKDTFMPKQNYDELSQKVQTVKTQAGNYVTRVNWDDISDNTRKYLGIDPLTGNGGKERFVNLTAANIVDAKGNKKTEQEVNELFMKHKGKFKNVFDMLNAAGASYEVETVGREAGSDKVTRATRLTTYQKQTKDIKDKKLLMTDDDTPSEIEE